MVRKHIKVETDLYYRACDEMGLLVMQDMPSLRPLQNILPNSTRTSMSTSNGRSPNHCIPPISFSSLILDRLIV
jgi:hypothetical protein